MKLVVATEDDQIVNVEVDPGTEVENLKAILQAETDVPTGDQILMAGGKVVQSGTLSGNGLGDNDVVMLIKKQAAGASAGAGASGGNPLAVNPSDGSAVNPGEYIRFLKGDAAQLSQIAQVLPELHSAVMRDDHAEFQKILRLLHQKKMEQEARRKAEIDLLNADPFDMEAQRKIQEMIDQSNVNENYEMAMENTPEAFGSVIMLYVDMEVNGHPLKAFVDSGAQMTIMSLGCAQRLGLERLIDKRWQGVAKGVGTQKIIGRVHQAPIKVADKHLACAITVLEKEQDMDFLLGLDMLKRHQCCIDLEKNELRVGSADVSLPFLGEADLPAHARPQNFEEQPPIPTPAGGGAGAGAGITGAGAGITGAGAGITGAGAESGGGGPAYPWALRLLAACSRSPPASSRAPLAAAAGRSGKAAASAATASEFAGACGGGWPSGMCAPEKSRSAARSRSPRQ